MLRAMLRELAGCFCVVVVACVAVCGQRVAAGGGGMPVQLAQHVPGWVTAGNDLGTVDGGLELGYLRLTLARPLEREAAFEKLLLEQQNPGSPSYHQWLTPEQIGQKYGPDEAAVRAVTAWLGQQGLEVDSVAHSRMFVVFHGSAAAVSRAFRTEIHRFAVGGGTRVSASVAPSIPAELAGVIRSVQGLSEHRVLPAVHARPGYSPCYDSTCYHFVAPGDFAAIYDISSVYSGGVTGSGQTIAIVGRAQVYGPDITEYQANTGLAQVTPTLVVPPSGVAPAAPNDSTAQAPDDDQTEATLDVQRVAGTAPGAAVLLVASQSTQTEDGIDIAKDYVIDGYSTLHAAVLSNSFGACEADVPASAVQADDTLFQQAAAEGISVVGISGDSGAAGCDPYNSTPPASQVKSPNYLCSSGYVTCMGGTEFNDAANPSTYWSTTSSATLESALGYIPEGAWNEPETGGDFYASSTGGGVSSVIATPYWQTGAGVPGSAGRYTPDISFTSAAHDGYYGCYAAGGGDCNAGYFEYFYGTSAAAPSMAGVVALLNQKEGRAQGNLNPVLYALANRQGSVFHDVTVASSGVTGCAAGTPSMCNNSTPAPASLTGGLAGYTVGAGFDLATGWGSVDVAKLLQYWAGYGPAASSTSLAVSSQDPVAGSSVTFTTKVTETGGTAAGTVTYSADGVTFATQPLSNGSATLTVSSAGLAPGSYPVEARYSGSAVTAPSTSAVVVVTLKAASSTTTLAISPSQVTPPADVSATATVASAAGTPTGTVTFYYEASPAVSLGTVSVANGRAVLTLPTNGIPAGTYPVQAVYSGSSTVAGSVSAKVNAVVK